MDEIERGVKNEERVMDLRLLVPRREIQKTIRVSQNFSHEWSNGMIISNETVGGGKPTHKKQD